MGFERKEKNLSTHGTESKDFLDRSLLEKIRNVVDEYCHVLFRTKSSLIYAALERMDHAAEWLNDHQSKPSSDEELILFVMYTKMIIEAVCGFEEVLKSEGGKIRKSRRSANRFFGMYYRDIPIEHQDGEIFSDDDFFSYFRALSFAHCIGADQGRILSGREITHYSPWVIYDDPYEPTKVGLRLYTNKSDAASSLLVEFNDLKAYVASRFRRLVPILRCAWNVVSKLRAKWRADKVCRYGTTADRLKDVIRVATNRGVDTADFKKAYTWLTIPSTNPSNAKSIGRYRTELGECINAISGDMDKLCHTNALEKLYPFVHYAYDVDLPNKHALQSIFADMTGRSARAKRDYSLRVIQTWAKGFPSKWVVITQDMSLDEMQMLAMVACYLEMSERRKCAVEKKIDTSSGEEIERNLKRLLKPIPKKEVLKAEKRIKAINAKDEGLPKGVRHTATR